MLQFLRRFENDGCELFIRRRYNGQQNGKITMRHTQLLTSEACLQRWAGWTLGERVKELSRLHGLQIHQSTLWAFYKKHDIKVRYANYMYKHKETESWHAYKRSFVLRLAQLVKDDKPVCFFDESSFNSWCRPKRTYRGPKDNVRIAITKDRHGGITIYGCIGSCLNTGFVNAIAISTNTDDVCAFMSQVRASVKRKFHHSVPITVVLDNHRAH